MSIISPTFISISLVSNRPKVFREFLDNFEQTAYNPSQVEIIVGIDDGDEPMQVMVRQEQKQRRLKLKFLSKPYTGFLNLYKLFDEMHYTLCDPDAYFVQHMNDELRHLNPHWDKILKERYTNLFDDDIYRLRLSMYMLWNYHSIYECGPHPENIPIHTKKWVDLTGWCACHSADSYQQMIAYYLGKADDGGNRFYRDIPIVDIKMKGLEAGVGVETPEQIAEYNERARKAWEILFSDAMQIQAQQKANILRAHIKCCQMGIKDFSIAHEENFTRVYDAASRQEIIKFPMQAPERTGAQQPNHAAAQPLSAGPVHSLKDKLKALPIPGARLLYRILRACKRRLKSISYS